MGSLQMKDSNREAFEKLPEIKKRLDMKCVHFNGIWYATNPHMGNSFATAGYLNGAWMAWQATKAQAVPEWKDYTVESPRIDGPYQIFIMDQQLVAKWESPWGFSSVEDGDAFNQELITHWSVLGSDPLTEPFSTSDCPDEP